MIFIKEGRKSIISHVFSYKSLVNVDDYGMHSKSNKNVPKQLMNSYKMVIKIKNQRNESPIFPGAQK